MARRIGVLEADQASTESPHFFEKKSIVRRWIRCAEAVWIIPGYLAQKLRTVTRKIGDQLREIIRVGYTDGPLGRGNILPFSPPTDATKKHHYEIPRAGDASLLRRHTMKRLRVSSRNLFARQPTPPIPLAVG